MRMRQPNDGGAIRRLPCAKVAVVAMTAALATPVLFAPAPASAATLLEDFFARRGGAAPCHARVYDAAHLAAHPRQRVTTFFIRADGPAGSAGQAEDGQTVFRPGASGIDRPESESEPGNRDGALDVAFGFTLKNDDDLYQGMASCAASGDGAMCIVEGDGGSFRLERNRDGRLRVVIDEGLALEGGTGFSPDLAVGGDDSPILLSPAAVAACVAG